VDVDKDGKLDIVSGCYWKRGGRGGHIQWLKGLGGNSFAKSVEFKTKSGQPLMMRVPKEDPEKLHKYSNIATDPYLADFNSDGLMDVVIGGFKGNFFTLTGAKSEKGILFNDDATFLRDESGKMLNVGSKSSPDLVDWDKDGDLDLIASGNNGAVHLSVNNGTKTEPKWAPFKQLIGPSSVRGNQDAANATKRAGGARICVVDFNNDGLLDIIVTDKTRVQTLRRGYSPEQVQQNKLLAAKYKGFLKEVMADKALNKETKRSVARSLGGQIRNYETGHMSSSARSNVWVFLQKKAAEPAAKEEAAR